ncbi:MAG: SH3 domain-containing protein [Euryarchaeota archaeon]|nr:SH3 domain-containing protein [Euryarchaeota archaeon]
MKSAVLVFSIIIFLASASILISVPHPEVRATYVKGVDVSHYQGTVNWTEVYQDGYRFAFVKATEGTTYVDSEFTANIKNAARAGLYVGAYHFAEPTTYNATAEAQHFLDVISPYLTSGHLFPVLDLEEGSSLGKTALSNWANEFMNYIYEKTGIRGIIYTNSNYAESYLDSSLAKNWSLWIAEYGVSAPRTGVWSTWNFWQYSDSGTVTGISGSVDMDYFNGDLQELYDNFVIHSPEYPKNLSMYDPQGAVGYASMWWNSHNPQYEQYATDSANFVAQALIAGGLSMWQGTDGAGAGMDNNGSMASCANLSANLLNFHNTEKITYDTYSVPSWLKPGDVVILNGTAGQHAALVVWRSGNSVGIASHTPSLWNASLLSYYTGNFTSITYIHIISGMKNITVFAITASALHVRAGPGVNYPIIGLVSSGQKYVAIAWHNDSSGYKWWEFFYDDRIGWCSAGYTETTYGNVWVVNASVLNVRSGPSTSDTVIGETYHGMLFVQIDSSGGWDEVWYSSQAAWVYAYYLAVPELQPMVIITMLFIAIIAAGRREK